MVDKKLRDLTELAAVPASGDEFYVRDISEPDADESKRITFDNLVKLRTTVAEGSRAAATGSGDEAFTGAGFAPTGVIIFARWDDHKALSWGFGDDSGTGEKVIRVNNLDGAPSGSDPEDKIINIEDGGVGQEAILKSLDSDGMTLTWTKVSTGLAIKFIIFYLR